MESFICQFKKHPFKYFLVKLAGFFVIVFVLDFSIGNFLSFFYFRQESGLQYRTTYSLEKTTADVLVFGSSRANHHYHPEVFEKGLNSSYYNVGRDGNFIFYHSAILKGVLKRFSPKTIILDFVGEEFRQNQDSYDRLSSLLPYYKNHPEIRPIVELKSKFEKIKMRSTIYPYNSLMFTIAVGNTDFNKTRRADVKGYVPLSKTWNNPIQIDSIRSEYEIDSLKVKAYDSFIRDCLKSKISLYIICSPYFVKSKFADPSILLGQEIAKKYNVKFFDYSNDSIFISNPAFFADKAHLNDRGAKAFSNLVIDQILKTRKENYPNTVSDSKSGSE